MRCEDVQARLGDLGEGTLDAETRAAMEAHLRDCPACAVLAADLARVRQLASTLDRLPPPPAAWPRIRERAHVSGGRRGAWTRSWVPLAIAACALLAVALAVVLRPGGHAEPPTAAVPATAAPVPVAEHPELKTVAEELRLAERHYENAITGLEKLANDREVLDPQVAAALQKNLQVIDLAISESRAALVKQPASEPAQQSLFEAFRTKIALLQDTIALINEMRKGNQAEAARIADGLKKS
jgi:anti-sigma factor RsiW